MDFGAWLGKRRREARLTMRELASRSRLSAPYIATIERNTSEPPPLKTCTALAKALGLDAKEVWEQSFAARLKRWLQKEGWRGISEAEILGMVAKIRAAAKDR